MQKEKKLAGGPFHYHRIYKSRPTCAVYNTSDSDENKRNMDWTKSNQQCRRRIIPIEFSSEETLVKSEVAAKHIANFFYKNRLEMAILQRTYIVNQSP